MTFGILILLMVSVPSPVQKKPEPPTSTGDAKTSGPCSPAVTGRQITINYNVDCMSESQIKEARVLNSQAYEGLGNAQKSEASIRVDWDKVLTICAIQSRVPRFYHGGSPTNTQLEQEKKHFCILNSEEAFDSKWKTARAQIGKAIDDAVGRVEENEKQKLTTINQRNAWKKEFDQTWRKDYNSAMAIADHSPSIEELVEGASIQDRFQPLTKYLEDLRTKLGDYPSQ